MLNREELEKEGPPGFKLGQKEKDYCQHWILSYLTRYGFTGIFKGGTCLEKAYNLPRYSEDLDFIASDREFDLSNIELYLTNAGFGKVNLKKQENATSIVYKVRIQGPLFQNKPLSEASIDVDFSTREKNELPPVIATVKPPYSDLVQYQIKVMDKVEIAAEKIRAIYTRVSPRDLYDLYFLFHQRAIPSIELVNKKLKLKKLSFEQKEFENRIKMLKRAWKDEITLLSPQFIDYKEVSETVKKETQKLQQTTSANWRS